MDGKERIFVADQENHRIQCLDPQGSFLFTFGSYGEGEGEFDHPSDVAVDYKSQRILVADTFNNRIQVFDYAGTFLFSFGDKGSGNGEFLNPEGITTDREGNIYVSDTDNNRIQVFDDKGIFLRRFGSKGEGRGDLKEPYGIGILSNGEVVVADHQRLSVFDSQGQFVRLVGEASLRNPWWLFVDSQDNILVPDFDNRSVFVFSSDGEQLQQFGREVFNNTYGVTANLKGEIFVSGRGKDDQCRIFVF